MKILFVITSLRNGGAEHLVADLLPRMKEEGHEMELAIFDGTPTSLKKIISNEGIKIHTLGNGAWQMWNPLHVFRIREIIKKGNFDIVHTHNSPAQLLTAFAGVKDLSKFVTTEHNTHNRRRGTRWGNFLDNRIYSSYHHIVCVSEQTKYNLFNHVSVDPKKVTVIPNGIDLKRFNSFPSECKGQDIPAVPSGSKIVFMAGAFRKQKDQQTLIKAMQHLPDYFILWLAGGWFLRKECEKLSLDLGISDRVCFLGERNDIPKLLKTADIVILSTHYEGMSLSAIECMASGKPFIASDVPGVKEIATGAAMLVPEGDDKALADAIFEISINQSVADSIIKKCRDRVLKFDISNTLQAHLNLYENLCR